MQTATTPTLELVEGWLAGSADDARVRFNFPISAGTGAEASAIVYFELEPGKRLARHTDSAEEILYVVAGEGEAEVDGERGRIAAGDLAVIPALAPHAVANTGGETLKVVGFFAAAEVTSVFEEALQPWDATVLRQPAAA
jgi:quercetin dioxygenase-like cupin family protein